METSLYLPVKRHLESLGFSVKGEVGGCDLVALNGDDPPVVVIGELKLSFNLELILQGVERAGACEDFECGLRPDPGHAFSEIHGVTASIAAGDGVHVAPTRYPRQNARQRAASLPRPSS